MIRTFEKDPADRLDYSRDWSAKLGANEVIVASTWTIDPQSGAADELVVVEESFNTTSTTVWIDHGTPGARYRIANSILTNLGRRWERSLDILLKEL